MAKSKTSILEQACERGLANPSAGMSVPKGYFEDFAARMNNAIDADVKAHPANEPARPRTFWQQIRPYVYMAAMFAGIWCMMHLFSILSGAGSLQPMSENPLMAKALASDEFAAEYIYPDITPYDIVDEMMEDGVFDPDDTLAPND